MACGVLWGSGSALVRLSAGGVSQEGCCRGSSGVEVRRLRSRLGWSPPVFGWRYGSGGATVGTPLPWNCGEAPGFEQGASCSLCHWYHNTPVAPLKITSLASRVLTGPTANTRAYLLHIQPVLFCPGEHGNETLFPSLTLCWLPHDNGARPGGEDGDV